MISRLNRKGASRHSVALSSLPVASRAIADIELFSLRDILGQSSHSSNKQKTEGSQKRNDCNAHSKLLSLVLESLFLSRKRTKTVAARTRHPSKRDYSSSGKDDTSVSTQPKIWREQCLKFGGEQIHPTCRRSFGAAASWAWISTAWILVGNLAVTRKSH